MQSDKIPPSSSDKTIGWIFVVIGTIGTLYAAETVYHLHNTRPNYTVGLMVGGFIIFELVPFLFLSSGRYYLTGKNAERKAKKNKGPSAAPQTQNGSVIPPQSPTVNPVNTGHGVVVGCQVTPTVYPQSPAVPPAQPVPPTQQQPPDVDGSTQSP